MGQCNFSDLIKAISEQTKAINALVQSNRDLIDCMAGQDGGEDQEGQEERQTYMDGTPVRD